MFFQKIIVQNQQPDLLNLTHDSTQIFTTLAQLLVGLLTLIALSGMSITAYAATAVGGITPPELNNTAYVLMDFDTGEILAQKNADQPLPPASLTKMMTSYIIEQKLESGELKEDDQVLMSENAWCRGSSKQSCMYVPVNKHAKVIDMLRGIIIQSGNDASTAMAEHIAGDVSAFAGLMNAEAKKLGMNHTHFVNATGMPADGHQASAHDLAILARAIIANSSKYYPIYAEKSFTYNKITQANRNALLFTDNTVDGLKTGHTNAAGFCLVASSKRGDMRLISVIMGTDSMKERANQSRALLNWGFGHFDTKVIAPNNQYLQKVPVWFGKIDETTLTAKGDLKVLVPVTQTDAITTQVDVPASLDAPIDAGKEVGTLNAMLNGQVVASVPVQTVDTIPEAGFFSRMWDHIKKFFTSVF